MVVYCGGGGGTDYRSGVAAGESVGGVSNRLKTKKMELEGDREKTHPEAFKSDPR